MPREYGADREPTAVVVPDLLVAELAESQPVIYDRPIGLRQLYRDPTTGAEHYLVDYPRGLTAAWHSHSAAHTIVVLAGALEVNGAIVGPGSYCHFPARTPMRHQAAAGHSCRFVILFDGPFDVFPDADPGM